MADAEQVISLKKWFLYTLIGSVACSALLGIGAVVWGDFGEIEIRILLTTVTIAAASICGLSCGAVLESGRASVLPSLGIGLSLVAACAVILGVWGEFSNHEFWKGTLTFIVLGIACSHASLLLLARLNSSYRWSHPAAQIAIALVAGLLLSMIWGRLDEEAAFRTLGVAAILATTMTVLIPVFHRLSRSEGETMPDSDIAALDEEIEQLEQRLVELRQRRDQMVPVGQSVPAARIG